MLVADGVVICIPVAYELMIVGVIYNNMSFGQLPNCTFNTSVCRQHHCALDNRKKTNTCM